MSESLMILPYSFILGAYFELLYSLSSPFMDASSACGFFDIILGLFLEADVKTGKLVGALSFLMNPRLRINADLNFP